MDMGFEVYAFGVTNCEFSTSLSIRYSRRYLFVQKCAVVAQAEATFLA